MKMSIEADLGIIISKLGKKQEEPYQSAEEKIQASFQKLMKISEDVQNVEASIPPSDGTSSDDLNYDIPEENQIEPAPRDEPLKSVVSPEYVKKVMRELDTMSTEMLKQALTALKMSASGTKRQLRKKVAYYYRKENMLLNRKIDDFNSDKTFRYFDYLVAIDFECTCVEVIYNYPHEIIELPAVLIDVKEMKIISMFRTYIRPVKNPILSDFCIDFTKIAQETVDKAPYFREGLHLFFDWMRSFGLGEKGVRFAFVTDGPHDMWKFMQYQCILSGMKMPHMFRSFINIKKIFKDRFHGIAKGNGKSGIENMLAKFELKFQGNKHSGLDDAKNIAYICLEMMKRKIELRINQKCVYKTNKSVIQEEEDEDPQADRRNIDTFRRDFQLWMRKLPLKLHTVTRREFLNEEYLDCESCDEITDEQNDPIRMEQKMKNQAEIERLILAGFENSDDDEESSEEELSRGVSEIDDDSDYEDIQPEELAILTRHPDDDVELESVWRGDEESTVVDDDYPVFDMDAIGMQTDQYLTSSSSGSTMVNDRRKDQGNEEVRAPRNSLASVYRNYGMNRMN